jgi:hypothetical protein
MMHRRQCVSLFYIVCMCGVWAQQDFIVQIAADSTEEAAEIVSVLQEPCAADAVLPCDYTFQVVEATTSFVHTVDDLGAFQVETPPMLQIKTDLHWDAAQQVFELQYESIPSSDYFRVLYFVAQHFDAQTGDSGNQCLVSDYATTADITACWDELQNQQKYILVSDAQPPSDTTTLPTEDMIARNNDLGLEILVTNPDSQSAIQLITIKMTQGAIFGQAGNVLGTHKTMQVDGSSIHYYSIGIGMLYWYKTGRNVIMFDTMHLIENSVNIWHASTVNQYTLARHINFQVIQTEAAQNNHDVHGNLGSLERAIVLQILLQEDFMLLQDDTGDLAPLALQISFWDSEVSNFVLIRADENDSLQDALDARFSTPQEQQCFNPRSLIIGIPQINFVDVVVDHTTKRQQLLTIMSAIPNRASVLYNVDEEPALKLSVALKLCHIDDASSTPICDTSSTPVLSLMNLESIVPPTPVCNQVISQTWSVIDLVQMSMFTKDTLTQKLELHAQCDTTLSCSESAQLYQSEVIVNSFDVLSSLLLIVIHPRNSVTAGQYFAASDKIAQLDDLYVTHDIDRDHGLNLQTAIIDNGHSFDANFRTVLNLDPRLQSNMEQECYLQTPTFAYSEETKCITTHDFDHNGPIARPNLNGGPSSNFVHQLHYLGSELLKDISTGRQIFVSFRVSFILYIPSTILSEGIQTSGSVLGILRTSESVITWEDIAYYQYIITFDADTITDGIITLQGAAGAAGNVDTIITLTAKAELDAAVNEDLAWLAQFYPDSVETEKLNFYQDSRAQIASVHKASFYWVNPTFHWPVSLLGLVDMSLLSMAWSVSLPSQTGSTRRRLLQMSETSPYNMIAGNADSLHQARQLNQLSTACGMITDERNISHLQWRTNLMRALNCTNSNSDFLCQKIDLCDYLATDSCVWAITEGIRKLHMLPDWEASILWDAPSDSEFPYNASILGFNAHHTKIYFQQSFVLSNASDRSIVPAPAAVVINDDFGCQVAVNIKNSEYTPTVLAVPYDNVVPPPLEVEVFLPNNNRSCSLEALSFAMLPMQLLHVTTRDAIFVDADVFKILSDSSTIRDSRQAKFFAAHRAAWNLEQQKLADSALIREQKSFFTLPRLVLEWLYSRPAMLHNTEQVRIALTCGTSTYHEQLEFGRMLHTRRKQNRKKKLKPIVRVY